jgi:hypothetical protein
MNTPDTPLPSLTPTQIAWEELNVRVSGRLEGEYGPFTNKDWQNISTIHTELAAANAEALRCQGIAASLADEIARLKNDDTAMTKQFPALCKEARGWKNLFNEEEKISDTLRAEKKEALDDLHDRDGEYETLKVELAAARQKG